MPKMYSSDDLNNQILELFKVLIVLEEAKLTKFSRNILFRYYTEQTKKSFSSFEKNFLSLAFAYCIIRQQKRDLFINNTIFKEMKKNFKNEWETATEERGV